MTKKSAKGKKTQQPARPASKAAQKKIASTKKTSRDPAQSAPRTMAKALPGERWWTTSFSVDADGKTAALRTSLMGAILARTVTILAILLALGCSATRSGCGGDIDTSDDLESLEVQQSDEDLPKGAIARLGSVHLRHPREVWSAFFSLDGKTLISSSPLTFERTIANYDGIRIWDAKTGKLLRRIGGLPYGPGNLAMSPDGKLLATESGASVVSVVDLETGRIRYQITWADHGNVIAAVFSPDGRTLALTGAGSRIQLWSSNTGEVLRKFGPDGGWDIAYAPDGKSIASSGRNMIHLWDAESGKEVWNTNVFRDRFSFGKVAFSPDGKLIAASGQRDGGVVLLEAVSGKEIRRWSADGGEIHAVSFSPNGKLIATGSESGAIGLWSVPTGSRVRNLSGHGRITYALGFSPDGKTLVSGGHDNRVRIWDVDTGKELLKHVGDRDSVSSIAYTPDGHSIIAADQGGAIRFWDFDSKVEKKILPGDHLGEIACSPNGKTLAASSKEGVVRLYDLAGNQQSFLPGNGQGYCSLAFGPEGDFLAVTGDDSAVHLWQIATGKEPSVTKTILKSNVRSLSFAPDGKTIALGSNEGAVHVYDAARGNIVREFPGSPHRRHTAVAFRPDNDGRSLATLAFDGQFQLLDVKRGKRLSRYDGGPSGGGVLAFSPDGWFLACGARETGELAVWETVSGIQMQSFRSMEKGVHAIAYAPDGKTIATGIGEASIIIWDATGLGAVGNSAAILPEKDVETAWESLASAEGPEVYHAIWRLRCSPREAAPFLGKRLTAVKPLPAEQVANLLAQLDDASSARRDKASQELEKVGQLAVPELEKAAANSPSAEVRSRCETLLEKISDPPLTADVLRQLRALAVQRPEFGVAGPGTCDRSELNASWSVRARRTPS